ncbi:hypothetical protein SAMN03159453_03282 [Pseudomonas sp. NFIX28]|nr:hypothetical protein SAMN03159453_03282 [Pseudomonas sp. NFIX28]
MPGPGAAARPGAACGSGYRDWRRLRISLNGQIAAKWEGPCNVGQAKPVAAAAGCDRPRSGRRSGAWVFQEIRGARPWGRCASRRSLRQRLQGLAAFAYLAQRADCGEVGRPLQRRAGETCSRCRRLRSPAKRAPLRAPGSFRRYAVRGPGAAARPGAACGSGYRDWRRLRVLIDGQIAARGKGLATHGRRNL